MNENVKFWQNHFEKELAVGLLNEATNIWDVHYYDALERLLFRIIPELKTRQMKILEVGCGSGTGSIRLGLYGHVIHLLDASAASLEYAQQISQHYGVTSTLIKGDFFKLPFHDEIFDLVWNVGSLEEYPRADAIAMVQEMRRVTKRGGYVVIGIPNPRNPEICYARKHGLWQGLEHDYDENDLNFILRIAGFPTIQITHVPSFFAFGYFGFLAPFIRFCAVPLQAMERIFQRNGIVIIGYCRNE